MRPLSPAQDAVMRVLRTDTFLTASDVAKGVRGGIAGGLNAGSAARILRQLMEAGLVEQTPLDASGRWTIYGYRRTC